jgi:hypothetical protein
MTGIARTVQTKGRLRPSFFFCLVLLANAAGAQQEVYRCGHEYTNTPQDAQRCERLVLPAVTVISGTRAQAGLPATSASAEAPRARAPLAPQGPRDATARTIVVAELDKARAQHADLLREWRQLPPAEGPKQQHQAEQLKAAIERTERDIESLQRELARKTP